MNLFLNLETSIIKNSKRNAFFIQGKFYSYLELAQTITRIRNQICSLIPLAQKNIGLVANDDLETYATIIALWFEGKCYIPLNPDFPLERNIDIIYQSQIKTIIDSGSRSKFKSCLLIDSKSSNLTKEIDLSHKISSSEDLVYILFTSGSTGKPKGVPISLNNLSAFMETFVSLGFSIDHDDRCLQMFELTFDFSVLSYLFPLLNGACVYTVARDEIKYSYGYRLIEDYQLTFITLVPSTINYLAPYFDEINLRSVKYCIFGGEALHLTITKAWSKCIPKANIINIYGPTETTIFTHYYIVEKYSENKIVDGILSIGKSTNTIDAVLIDENNKILGIDTPGELCVHGKQVTDGYFNDKRKTNDSFIKIEYQQKVRTFYKTGDLCKVDDEGYFFYLGRIDFQAKIQGHRVELSEIEHYSKQFLDNVNVVAIAIKNRAENQEIALFIESESFETDDLINFLKLHIPKYMLPTKFHFIDQFPLNSNGKLDRIILRDKFVF